MDKRGVVVGFGACEVSMSSNGTRKVVESKTFDGKLRFAKMEITDRTECPNIPEATESLICIIIIS